MGKSKLYKIIVGLSIVGIVLLGMLYFVYSEIKSKNQKISIIEQELLSKKNKYDHLVSMQKLVKDIEPDVKKIEESIIPKSGDVDFIESIEALARSNDLSIQIETLNLVSDPKVASSTVSTLKIKAKTDGTWLNTYVFLSEIESSQIKLKINKLALTSSEDLVLSGTTLGTQGKKWQANFEISLLEYK